MTCDLCTKRHLTANKISHSNIKTKRRQNANVKRVRALVKGKVTRLKVCTRCLRSGKVQKAA
jgi:large subunit ribosomal protein L28